MLGMWSRTEMSCLAVKTWFGDLGGLLAVVLSLTCALPVPRAGWGYSRGRSLRVKSAKTSSRLRISKFQCKELLGKVVLTLQFDFQYA